MLAGRYRLLEQLGEGGMGSVWRARNLLLHIDVAVKLIKRDMVSPTACERLMREARAAAALTHPSIVRMLDAGTTADGEPFLVMQLLRGNTLRHWIEEGGRIPAVVAVQIVLPLAAAIGEAHDLGIVHRDIKPDNIILEEGAGGRTFPRLVDFGIAKQSDLDSSVTQSGALVGSPAYMSPEQARGSADAQSDVWSLCVVLYEMICGRRPFEGDHKGEVLFSVFSRDPAPTHTLGAGDAALWEILRRGLAKEREERWASMRELRRALVSWARRHGVYDGDAVTSLPHQWLCSMLAADLSPLDSANERHAVETADSDAHSPSLAPAVSTEVSAPTPRRYISALGLSGIAASVAVLTFALMSAGRVEGAAAAPFENGQMAYVAAASAEPPPVASPAIPPARPEKASRPVPAATAKPAPEATSSARAPSASAPRPSVRPVAPVATPKVRPARPAPLPLPRRPDF
ncbi:MAG: protein kinase [Polyangiaceae bacterium]